MSARFEQAELLKKQYTDKFVVVKSGVPELKRFQGLTGVVKTVNMSCRALVLFDGPADIAWYDIDPTFLTVVDAPAPKKADVKVAKESPTSKEAPAPKSAPAAKPAGEKKLSPLEMIRQQAGAGAKPAPVAAPPSPAAAPAAGGAKLSPLEMIRQQQAKLAGTAPATVAPATVAPATVAPATVAPAATSAPAPAAVPASAPAETPKPAAPAAASGEKLSPLDMVRKQGAFKGK